jgi:paired amphipathic helix protein Sin3a
MCKSVLNDEWVSHPSWAFEDTGSGGFTTHKKNVYEEALHRSEEERHEYDFHIEAIVRTIAILEPLNNKILQLAPEELQNFKLKPNLNGMGKAVHQRVIKKIYGREAGVEVVKAVQETPALAIPVVLTRLKQKEEEWKRAQREWNKVWREVDARNYWKSLDYQGITFRQADKRAMAARTLVNQIEAAREEQMAKRAQFIDPLYARTRPRHQLELEFGDVAVLQDAMKLIFSFLDRTAGQIAAGDRRRVEGFLRTFIPVFFMQDAVAFNAAFAAVTIQPQDAQAADASDGLASVDVGDEADVSSAAGSSRAARSGRKSTAGGSTGDLRKRLLKSEQAKSSRKTRGQGQEAATPSPSSSRRASPARSDAMDVDQQEAQLRQVEEFSATKQPRKGSFFTNTNFYVLLRQLEASDSDHSRRQKLIVHTDALLSLSILQRRGCSASSTSKSHQ